MKHITTFNESVESFSEFTQKLSETISVEQFKNLKPKQQVKYMGTTYIVDKHDDVTVTLKDEENDETIEVNYNMFKDKGFINEGFDTAKNYEFSKGDEVILKDLEGTPSGKVYDITDHNKSGKFNPKLVSYWVDSKLGKMEYSGFELKKK